MKVNFFGRVIFITIGLLLLSLLVIFYAKSYYLPWEDDFWRHERQYMKVVALLSDDPFFNVTYLWDLSIVENGIRCYYNSNKDCRTRYDSLIRGESLLVRTYFQKCPNGIIKISKWGWINNFFDIVYVYSKEGFQKLPSRARGRINDNVILYHNFSSTYTSDEACQLK